MNQTTLNSYINSATREFILQHDGEDTTRLLLSNQKWEGVDIGVAARCIESRKKIKHKVPTFYEEPSLLYPDSLSVEQCSSQATATYKSTLVPTGSTVADLTGGLGVDSYFLSKRCNKLHYFERRAPLAEAAIENFKTLGCPNIEVHHQELTLDDISSERFEKLNIIMIDPARRDKMGGKVFSLSQCEPDLTSWCKPLLEKCDLLIAKISPMVDIPHLLSELEGISRIHIVSVNFECKELLLEIRQGWSEEPEIVCINIVKGAISKFSFYRDEESCAKAQHLTKDEVQGLSLVGGYIYEPNKSISKGGPFKLLSKRFDIKKISPNTHLYLSEEYLPNFPGKCFKIVDFAPFNKKNISEWGKRYPKVSVTAKNIFMTSEELAKKMRVSEGDALHVFGFPLGCGTKVLICGEPIRC